MHNKVKVNVQVLGGEIKQIEAATVADVKAYFNLPSHTATVNGEPASDDQVLDEFEFVALAPAVKGGRV